MSINNLLLIYNMSYCCICQLPTTDLLSQVVINVDDNIYHEHRHNLSYVIKTWRCSKNHHEFTTKHYNVCSICGWCCKTL